MSMTPGGAVAESGSAMAGILIVEDESIVAKDIQRTLSRLGYRITGVASSGEDAVRKATERRPDLIIMDIRLRGKVDGVEAASAIREHVGAPVIFLTAHSDAQTLQRATLTEPFGYVVKPFKEAELRGAIEVALRKDSLEARLRERERLLKTTLCSISEAVITTDSNERVTFLNPTAEVLTGWRTENAVGQPVDNVVRISSEKTGEELESPIRRALHTGAATSLDQGSILMGARGPAIPIDDSAAPIKDDLGQVLGAVMVFRDISEKKRTEAERERLLLREQEARAEAEAASRSKDEFLSRVSHELRTPLNAVLGWTQILKRCNLDSPKAQRAISAIESSAKAQTALVGDLFDASRAISGRLALDIHPVEIVQLVHEALEALRPAADAKGIHIELNSIGTPCLTMGDANRLRQVVWNLVSNAVKFCPEGASVHVSCERTESNVRIVVRDTGPGIAAELLPYIFDRFRQGDSTTTRAHSGLGLGLAIVRELVELHGGTVSAASSGMGLGSTFTVTLPSRNIALAPHHQMMGAWRKLFRTGA
jgi:PAS domain S-box-containing protein